VNLAQLVSINDGGARKKNSEGQKKKTQIIDDEMSDDGEEL
jgi:hypothetical protein